MTCRCKGCSRSTDSSIIYELCRKDINAAISLWGTWPFEPCSQTASSIHRQQSRSFSFGDCPRGGCCIRQGNRSGPDFEPFVMCISSFALFYERLKSVSKQLSNPPQGRPQEVEKPCPAFSWEPQIFPYTNFALISWPAPYGKTFVLL